MARIVFMGTPQFAVPILLALAEHHSPVGVITQPDRPAGRGRQLQASPVKDAALAKGLPVFQPETLRSPEAVQRVAEWGPDLIVVAAFGQILRADVLSLPPFGCLNVHASLLPRYRGAAPIPATILAGDAETGVTLMQMDAGLDSGPILAQAACPIAPGDTTGSLAAKLADLGARLVVDTLPAWLRGEIRPQPQDPGLVTYCRALKKEDGHLDWSQPASYLARLVRACDPWPGTYTTWNGQRLRVLSARLSPSMPGAQPGQVVVLDPSGLGVITADGVLELLEVQLAGRKPLPAALFARGQPGLIGALLGI